MNSAALAIYTLLGFFFLYSSGRFIGRHGGRIAAALSERLSGRSESRFLLTNVTWLSGFLGLLAWEWSGNPLGVLGLVGSVLLAITPMSLVLVSGFLERESVSENE